jgi:hypothetical protein
MRRSRRASRPQGGDDAGAGRGHKGSAACWYRAREGQWGRKGLQRSEAELQPQAVRERAGDDVTSWISLPPRARLAIFKLSASSQALFLVRFCCSFLFCLMDEGLGNLGV